jgi:hypothetical protein
MREPVIYTHLKQAGSLKIRICLQEREKESSTCAAPRMNSLYLLQAVTVNMFMGID